MQEREEKGSDSIKRHQKILEELNVNAQNTLGQIRTAFAKARATLDKRENELLSETEVAKLLKEKELKLQKEGLEMFGEGMRSASLFTKTLLANGSQVEIQQEQKSAVSLPVLAATRGLSFRVCLSRN